MIPGAHGKKSARLVAKACWTTCVLLAKQLWICLLGFKSRLHPDLVFWWGVACIIPAMDLETDSPLGQLSAYFDTARSLPDSTNLLYCMMYAVSHLKMTMKKKNQTPSHCRPPRLSPNATWVTMWTRSSQTWACSSRLATWALPTIVVRGGWSVYNMCVCCCKLSRWWRNWSWNRTTALLTRNLPSLWCHQVLSLSFGLAWTTLTSRLVARMAVGCFQNATQYRYD